MTRQCLQETPTCLLVCLASKVECLKKKKPPDAVRTLIKAVCTEGAPFNIFPFHIHCLNGIISKAWFLKKKSVKILYIKVKLIKYTNQQNSCTHSPQENKQNKEVQSKKIVSSKRFEAHQQLQQQEILFK